MIKIVEIATGKELTFESVQQAADFLGMKKPSVYTKFRSGRTNDGYKITQLDFTRTDAGNIKKKDFKRCTIGDYKVEFLNNTSIISWKRNVDDDFDDKKSYITTKKAISGILRENIVFSPQFILLQEISPKSYTNLPPEKEELDLYVQFKQKLDSKKKKDAIQHLLSYL